MVPLKTKVIQVEISEKEHQEIVEFCAREKLTRREFYRQCVRLKMEYEGIHSSEVPS